MAQIRCSMCSGSFDDSRHLCPGCGFTVSAQAAIESPQRKRPDADLLANSGYRLGPPASEQDLIGKLFWFIPVSFVAILILSCTSTLILGPSEEIRAEQKAVHLDRGNFGVGATASTQTTLARLSSKYGMSEKLIASKLLVAQDLLAKKHVHMTVQKIANSIEYANPTTLPVSFNEVLAAFVTLCGERSDEVVHQSYDGEIDPAESRKKKMFFELVAAQDAGVGDGRAYSIIAERYDVPEEAVREIAIEGVTGHWPMP